MRIWLACLVLCGCDGASNLGSNASAKLVTADSQAADTAVPEGQTLSTDSVRPFAVGTLPNPEHAPCLWGTSDAAGHVALGRGTDLDAVWSFYSRTGTALGSAVSNPDPLHGDTLVSAIFPGKSSFQVVSRQFGLGDGGLLIEFAPSGTRLVQLPIYGRLDDLLYLQSIPAGGVNATTFSNLQHANDVRWIDVADALDDDDDIFVTVPYDDLRTFAVTDLLAHTLALYPGLGTLRAQWLNADGSTRVGEFALALPANARLSPLIGGGFAVRSGDDWVGTLASDATAIAAAPTWLAHRPRTRLAIVEHGRRYALLFDDGATSPGLPQTIELRRRNGEWAGALLAWPAAGSFASQQTRIGRDGTVVQLLSRPQPTGLQCAYRWWPGLLRSGINGDGTSVCVAGSCP